MSIAPLAVVSAMHEELRALLPLLQEPRSIEVAGRRFYLGQIHGHGVVLALSGIGKVSAATTATLLVGQFAARELIFTGVAGGLRHGVNVGDVVVADQLLQHDMDASPLFPRFEVPLTGRSRFDSNTSLSEALADAAQRCLKPGNARSSTAHLKDLGIGCAAVHRGLIISGDRFVSSELHSSELRSLLPDALAVEMEGAAIAQVCAEFDRPFGVLRTISDRADDDAHTDFNRFIEEVASAYTREIISDWLQHKPRT